MKKTTIVNGLILTGLLGFIMAVPALASAPTGEYPYRIPVTITTSGGAVTENQPLCLEYDPQLLIDLGYATESQGSLENVRLNNLLGDDVWQLNSVSGPTKCNWFTGSAIADGSEQTYNLYTGHPTDTRTPVAFLTNAGESIDVAYDSSLSFANGVWLNAEGVIVGDTPDNPLLLIDKDGSYGLTIDASGYPAGYIVGLASGSVTNTWYPDNQTSYANINTISGCTTGTVWDCVEDFNDSSNFGTSIYYLSGSGGFNMTVPAFPGATTSSSVSCLKMTTRTRSNVAATFYWYQSYAGVTQSTSASWTSYTTYTGSCVPGGLITGTTISSAQTGGFYLATSCNGCGYYAYGSGFSITATYTALIAGSPVWVTYSQNLADGLPHDIAMEYDQTNLDLYIDGALVAQTAETSDIWENTDPVTVLEASGAADYYRAAERVSIAASSGSAEVLDLQFFGNALTLTDAGDAGDGWTWEYDIADQSGNGNDAAWDFVSDHTGITLALGALVPVLGLPSVLITSSLSDTVGTLNDLTAVATGSTFNGRASIQAAIDQIGAQSGTIWFLMLAFLGLLLGAWAVRFTGFSFLGLLIASAWCAVGWPLGLYAPWIGIVGCLALLGTGAGMALVNRR